MPPLDYTISSKGCTMGIVCFWPWYMMRFLNYAEYIEGSESSCLTYCNFLKHDKTVAEDCLLLYSSHLKRYREPRLIRPLMEI